MNSCLQGELDEVGVAWTGNKRRAPVAGGLALGGGPGNGRLGPREASCGLLLVALGWAGNKLERH